MLRTILIITVCGSAATVSPGYIDRLIPARTIAFASDEDSVVPATAQVSRRLAGRPIVLNRADDGLFYFMARINGTPVRFLLDTGASVTVLSARDAVRIGIDPDGGRSVPLAGVGGNVRVRSALIDRFALPTGDTLTGVDAVVAGSEGLRVSLIGQDTISRIGPITLDGDVMTFG